MRRWEEARIGRFFSREQIEAFRKGDREHILLVNEAGKFELHPYEQIGDAADGSLDIRAFIFDRFGETHIVFWHPSGSAQLELNVEGSEIRLFEELGREIPVGEGNGGVMIPFGDRQYLMIDLPREEAISLFRNARVVGKRKN
jgi:hypothetical protein